MTISSKYALRKIGNTGIKTTALGFGCGSLSPGFAGENVDLAEAEPVLRKALDSLAPVALNTADFYSSFTDKSASRHNLHFIGEVLKDYPRESAIIAMKWGPRYNPGEGWAHPDYSPAACRARVNAALAALGVTYIDFLILRLGVGNDENCTLEEIAQGMKAMVDEGKVKHIGLSVATPEEMRTIHAIVPISVIELGWSMFVRNCMKEIVPLGREMGASFLAYSPLGEGLLTGKLDVSQLAPDHFRKNISPRYKGEALNKNQQVALKVAELAAKKGCTPAQLALAWVLAQGDDVIPIPGTKRLKYLDDNMGALDVQLTAEEAAQLSAVIPEVVG